RAARRARKKEQGRSRVRRALSKAERGLILSKTGGRCHICGGVVDEKWQADHVLAHSGGGASRADNYLPAHRLCNSYRWDYLPEELQVILKMGVWARTQIENETRVGRAIAEAFLKYDRARLARRGATRSTRHS
ncbi:MAG: HNH endonuclease, partial [Bacillota bacterium]|nr:HNH endonuclease [Bacillota bacterium]